MIRSFQRQQRRRAFTIIEVMIAAALMAFVLTGVLSAFVMIGRTSFRSGTYSQIESETRRGLEIFGQDARLANDIHWNSNQSVTLTLPTATDATSQITYAYDGTADSPTAGCFYSVAGADASVRPCRILVRNVGPDFTFERFKLAVAGAPITAAISDAQTKQLKLTLRSSVRVSTTAGASQTAFSASYILRNKRVAN